MSRRTGPTSRSTVYALEATVLAAAVHAKQPVKKTHWDKRDLAEKLHATHGLPDVCGLLDELNEARKAAAYGDVKFPAGLDAEDVATAVEEYVEAVAVLIEGEPA
jgi:hypothetical protein